MAQWVASAATFLAVIVALLPILLNWLDRKKKAQILMDQIVPAVKELSHICGVHIIPAAENIKQLSLGVHTQPLAQQFKSLAHSKQRDAQGVIEKLRTLYDRADILRGDNYKAFCNFHASLAELSRFDPPPEKFARDRMKVADEFLNAVEKKSRNG